LNLLVIISIHMQKLLLPVILFIGIIHSNFAQQAKCVNGKNPITGEICDKAIFTAVPFLRIVPDSRSGAMGDAGLALSTDPNAMHFNSSKLAFGDEKFGIAATYTPWLRALGIQDVYQAYLSTYYKLDDMQALGASVKYFSLGQIQFTNEIGSVIAPGNPREMELALSYNRKLSNKFAAGITGKYIYSNLATGQAISGEPIRSGRAFAADLSATYKTPLKMSGKKTDLTIATAVTNLGQKIGYTTRSRDFLPANLGIGGAWKINIDEFNSLTLALDFNKLLVPAGRDSITRNRGVISGVLNSFSDGAGGEEFREITYSSGLEYWYDNQFAVRAGYFHESLTKGARRYFTAGVGLRYQIFTMNISYLVPTTNARNPLDNTLRFSLLFNFKDLNTAIEEDEGTSYQSQGKPGISFTGQP
jgi:hypothetical protein